MTPHLIPGSVWELSTNANCIPAGRYRFERTEEEFLVFSVGSKIIFGLCKDYYGPLLRPVATPDQRKTSTDSFLEEYGRLLQEQLFALPRGSGMTYCAMDASLQRKFRRLHQRRRPQGAHNPFH